MALTLLMLAPTAGARVRVTETGVDDAGIVYDFEWVPRPITIDDNPDIKAIWQRFGMELRHTGAIDLLVTPIVDSTELTAQAFAITASDPGKEVRRTYSGRFFAFGLKCTVRVQSTTLPALFNVDGAWFEGAPQPEYRET